MWEVAACLKIWVNWIKGNFLECNKSYKTKNGLVQHEKKKHSEYHGYPKKKLTLHHKTLGKKTLTIPCSEGMFLGVFKNDFERYSPARRLYLSSFVGGEDNEKLSNLFGDKDWSIRYFDNNQFLLLDTLWELHKSIRDLFPITTHLELKNLTRYKTKL